jgi:hypothetical protein
LIGKFGRVDVGVDFEEETVDEEIVIALPEEGGIICLGAGVGGACVDCFEGRGFATFMVEESAVGGGGGGGGGGALLTMTSSWTGLSISSTWARFLGTTAAGGVVSARLL